MTTIGVVVPSYARPDDLAVCLRALLSQDRPFDRVVVSLRAGDAPSALVARELGAEVLEVDQAGVLAAMIEGARVTSTDVVCFTDDDAIAPPQWSSRLLEVFERSALIGGVGGRDALEHPDGTPRPEALDDDVGRTTWYGRHVGNHHRGRGPARDVDFLKGVNCAYRRDALEMPVGLRGTGAQVHFEVAIGRRLRQRGWRLVYDPAITVVHRPAERMGEDQRGAPSRRAVADAAFNLVVALGGARGLARVAYAAAVGDRGCPGLLRCAVALVRRDGATLSRLGPSLRGTFAGGAAILRGRGVAYVGFD